MHFAREFASSGSEVSVLEAFEPNVRFLRTQTWLREVMRGDVAEFTFEQTYGIVFWWHGPEHIEAPELPRVLAKLEAIAREAVVLGSPWGRYPQGTAGGNPYEEHRSHLDYTDLESLGYSVECLGSQHCRGSNITAVKTLGRQQAGPDGVAPHDCPR